MVKIYIQMHGIDYQETFLVGVSKKTEKPIKPRKQKKNN